jgi:Lon protease-like protein
MKKKELPNTIPVFPLSNFIIFPKTTVPLNIFEPRYVEMINDSMKKNKFIGMIQPKSINNENSIVPSLHKIGCLGKITSFKETDDGRYLIDLKGVIRFKIVKEIADNKPYRSCEINFDNYLNDLSEKKRKFKIFRLRINI